MPGRDVRGIKRVHQFEKVEMYHYTLPEESYDHLEVLVANARGPLPTAEFALPGS